LTSIDTCYVDAVGSKVKGTNALTWLHHELLLLLS
jgi:hypothetical protein